MKQEARGSSWIRRLSVRLYRLALLRYPGAFRRRYGQEMVDSFTRLLDEAAPRGPLAMASVWLRVALDLARPLPGPVAPSPRQWATTRALSGTLQEAARSLRRSPGFTALIVAVLGVGIALNVTILAVVDAYLVQALPYPESEGLVEVRPAVAAVNTANSDDVFEQAVSWHLFGVTLVGDRPSEVVLGARVTPDFFPVFGAQPALGRAFGDDEDGPSVAVISHGLWARRYGSDPGILGRSIQALSGESEGGRVTFTVIGVLPADFWHVNGTRTSWYPCPRAGPCTWGASGRTHPGTARSVS